MTLKLDDSGCRTHSISDGPSGPRAPQEPHGNEEIVTNERYVVIAVEDGYQTWQKHDSQRSS